MSALFAWCALNSDAVGADGDVVAAEVVVVAPAAEDDAAAAAAAADADVDVGMMIICF
jgi:hypothetical protein